jgi:hypothetical protein
MSDLGKTGKRIAQFSQVLVAHTYNPSYSGGRDQEGLQFEAKPGK